MKKKLCCLLTVFMAGIGLFGCGSKEELPATAEQKTVRETDIDTAADNESAKAGNYTLQCIDAVYGTPLSDAEVRILDGEGRETATGNTDAQGVVHMQLEKGSYQAEVKKDGYYTEQKNVEVETQGQQDRIRLVGAFEEDRYLVMLEWDGSADLDLIMFDADQNQYIGKGNPTDDAGSFLYADNDAEQGYELFSAAKAEGVRTFYVKDRVGVADASSQMEAEGVTAKVYAPEGLLRTVQADKEENAALWIPFYIYQGEVQEQDEYVHDLKEHKEALYDQEALKAYQAFLDGEESATLGEWYEPDEMGEIELSKGEEYFIYDMIDKFEKIGADIEGEGESEKEYAFVDLGNDNVPELLIRYKKPVGPGLSWQGYFILGYQNTALRLLYCQTVLYGDDSLDFNYYGFYETSGGGAGYWLERVRMPDAAGRFTDLYKVESFGPLDFVYRLYTISRKKFVTYTIDDEASSEDRELCMEEVARSQTDGFELVTEEEIDTIIEREVEPEVTKLWKAEAPELEWHEWKLPQAGQPEGVETWKYNYLMILKDYFQGKAYFTGWLSAWTYKEGGGNSFSLEDLNNDGKMELLVGSHDSDGNMYDATVYVADKGAIYLDDGLNAYDPDKGYIKVLLEGLGYRDRYFAFDGVNATLIKSFDESDYDGDDPALWGKIYYEVDYVEVSKEEYDSQKAQYSEPNVHWKKSKAIDFTIENIEDAFNVNIMNRYGDWIITSR